MTDKLLDIEYGNEPLGCINGAEFLVHMSDYQLLCSYYKTDNTMGLVFHFVR